MSDAPALFSLIPFDGNVEELPAPDNGPYYVATRNGYMAMQRGHFGRTLTPVDDIPNLPETPSVIYKDIPKLPAELVGKVWSFFEAIYQRDHSEAMVDITWSEEHGYRIFVPPQKASYGGVQCQRDLELYHGLMVGTLHSHCNFGAFHSGTDKHDAGNHNGIHFTLGKVNEKNPEIAIMISQNGIMWDIKPEEAIEDWIHFRKVDHPKWWESFVEQPKTYSSSSSKTNQPKANGQHTPIFWGTGTQNRTPSGLLLLGDERQDGLRPLPDQTKFVTLMGAAYAADVPVHRNPTLEDMDKELTNIQHVLDSLGIDFDFEFTVQSTAEHRLTDEDEANWLMHWRQHS